MGASQSADSNVNAEVTEKASKLEKNEDREGVDKEIALVGSKNERETVSNAKNLRKDMYTFTVQLVNQETGIPEDVTFEVADESISGLSVKSKQYLPNVAECLQQGNMCEKIEQGKLRICVDVYGDDILVNYCTEDNQKFKGNVLVRSEISESFMTSVFFPRYFSVTLKDVTINKTQKGSVTFYVEKKEYIGEKVKEVKKDTDLAVLVGNKEKAARRLLRICAEYIIFNMMLIIMGILAVVDMKKIFAASGHLFVELEILKAMRVFEKDENVSFDVKAFIKVMTDILQEFIENFQESEEVCVNKGAVQAKFEKENIFENFDPERQAVAYEQIFICLKNLCNLTKQFFPDKEQKPYIKEAFMTETIPAVEKALEDKRKKLAVENYGDYTEIISPLANQ